VESLFVGVRTTYRVLDVASNGVATIDARFDSVSLRHLHNGTENVWSSGDTAAEPPMLAPGYSSIIGSGFVFRVRPDGVIVDVHGGVRLRDAISDRLSHAGIAGGMTRRSMMMMFDDSAMVAALADVFTIYPVNAVRIDDSWSRGLRIVCGTTVAVENRWRLSSLSVTQASIDVEGTMTTDGTVTVIDLAGRSIRYDLQGEQRGTIQVDRGSGWVLASRREQELHGTVHSFAAAQPGTQFVVPLKLRAIVTTSLNTPRTLDPGTSP